MAGSRSGDVAARPSCEPLSRRRLSRAWRARAQAVASCILAPPTRPLVCRVSVLVCRVPWELHYTFPIHSHGCTSLYLIADAIRSDSCIDSEHAHAVSHAGFCSPRHSIAGLEPPWMPQLGPRLGGVRSRSITSSVHASTGHLVAPRRYRLSLWGT